MSAWGQELVAKVTRWGKKVLESVEKDNFCLVIANADGPKREGVTADVCV